ncbi:nitrilase-related carbon-nitrogen hydrolase [Planococcus sp. APC 4015]|nr:nitrilase-related carbon-nitrogen hydrolase [Planococcus sp. APC 4015]
MTRTLRVAATSPDIRLGEVGGNVERIIDGMQAAGALGAQLIVVPELATCGYLFADRDEASASALAADDPVWDRLRAAVPDGAVAVIGYGERAGDRLFNTAAVLTRSTRIGDYRKAHLWGAESTLFTPGDGGAGAIFDTPLGRLGVAICYDNEFPEVPRRLALAGAEILALPVNWPRVPRPEGERPPETIQAMAAARSSRLATVIADRTGTERGVLWTGGTAVIDEDGWVAAASGADGIAVATLTLRAVGDKSLPPHNDLFGDRRPDLY